MRLDELLACEQPRRRARASGTRGQISLRIGFTSKNVEDARRSSYRPLSNNAFDSRPKLILSVELLKCSLCSDTPIEVRPTLECAVFPVKSGRDDEDTAGKHPR
jgi:hypothetical protein